jgi:hypothetical protein
MLQGKKPMRKVYFNGLTYAVKSPHDTILFICAKPDGPTIRVERFTNIQKGNTLNDYLIRNGYEEYDNRIEI